MRAALTPLLVIAALAALAPACADDPAPALLQSADLKKPEGNAKFDRNVVIDAASFTDIETVKPEEVQKFLGKTPYERPSFLETYQSNGVRAVDAIMRASRVHRINPLVFLVFAQITQGLLGERNYPFPPERVEYVFNCGCFQAKKCRPDLAGFDRQVDCLGKAFRTSLDEVAGTKERTTSGWGPNVTSLTLDGLKVTPENNATAALYDRLPRVNEGEGGGTYVFWNVLNLYAPKLTYGGAAGSVDGRWIGEPCATDGQCGVENGICATNYPDGLCTVECNGSCPTAPSRPETFCAKFRDGGFCFPRCNPNASGACRDGYECVRVTGFGTESSEHVCSPKPARR